MTRLDKVRVKMEQYEFAFVYFHSLVLSALSLSPSPTYPPSPLSLSISLSTHSFSFCLSRSLSTRKGERRTGRDTQRQRQGRRGKKDASRSGEPKRNCPQRCEAKEGEPATSQPDCKTLYKTRETRVRTIGSVHPLTAVDLCHPLSRRLPSKCTRASTSRGQKSSERERHARGECGYFCFYLFTSILSCLFYSLQDPSSRWCSLKASTIQLSLNIIDDWIARVSRLWSRDS